MHEKWDTVESMQHTRVECNMPPRTPPTPAAASHCALVNENTGMKRTDDEEEIEMKYKIE